MEERRELPECMRCSEGRLLPLSDAGPEGGALRYKAWVCSNPDCGFHVRIDDGDISFGRSLATGFG